MSHASRIDFPLGPLRILNLPTVTKIFDSMSGLEKGTYSIIQSVNSVYTFLYPQSMTAEQADKLLKEVTNKISHYSLEQIFSGVYALQIG